MKNKKIKLFMLTLSNEKIYQHELHRCDLKIVCLKMSQPLFLRSYIFIIFLSLIYQNYFFCVNIYERRLH